MAKWIEKQYQTSPLGAVVENSMASGSAVNAPSIKAVQNAFSNPNLLINSDFRNPVNTKGQTSYTLTSKDFAFNNWEFQFCKITINDGYITLSDTTGCWWGQAFKKDLPQDNYTLTIQVRNTTGTTYLGNTGHVFTKGTNIIHFDNVPIAGGLSFYTDAGSTLELEYMKLERGTIATPFVPNVLDSRVTLLETYKVLWSGNQNGYTHNLTLTDNPLNYRELLVVINLHNYTFVCPMHNVNGVLTSYTTSLFHDSQPHYINVIYQGISGNTLNISTIDWINANNNAGINVLGVYGVK